MSSTTASRLTGNPTSDDLDTLTAYINKMDVTQKAAIRSAIGVTPEQRLATWGSQLVGDYTSTLDVGISAARMSIAFCEDQNAISVVPNSGTLLYFGTPNSDGGVDWTTRTSPISLGSGNVEVVASESTFIFYLFNGAELYTTTNQGSSFTTVTFPDAAADIQKISYGNGLFVAVGDANEYYTSTDGVSWVDRGDFGTGAAYSTINVLKWVESISEWVLSVSTGSSYVTFYKANPAAGGNWGVVINTANASYDFRKSYECNYGLALISASIYIYTGSGATLVQDYSLNVSELTSASGASVASGGGLNVLTNNGELVYSKTDGDHTLSRASAPSIDSVGSGCYAGGGFNQFIFTSANGKIYYSLRG